MPRSTDTRLCILTEIELSRLIPEMEGPEFKDEDRPSNGKKIEI